MVLRFAMLGVLPSALSIPVLALLIGGVGALADARIAVGVLGISAMQLIPCAVAGVVAAAVSSRLRSDVGWIAVAGVFGFLTSIAFLFATPLYATFFQDRPITVLVTGVLGAAGTTIAAAFSKSMRRLPLAVER
ncbi:MAG: hypothetical protein KKG14_03920 [Alphaproteobacteria bacterium]|nr:hypothetical protein [Alphaproteobacteria bacterium]MBU2271167.1 hypothetical protein [Alphaproteobacteria bacterium]MBU2417829.1 hypothetical protein [Alphaproteobacteria bacterium]